MCERRCKAAVVAVSWSEGSRRAVRTASGIWRGQRPPPVKGAPGLHGVLVIVRGDLTAEPPAHCRLVSDHDLFEIVVLLDCTVRPSTMTRESWGEATCSTPTVIPLERHELRHSLGADTPTGVRAWPRRSRSAAGRPRKRVALRAAGNGALRSLSAGCFAGAIDAPIC
jgi:hypothetical protein